MSFPSLFPMSSGSCSSGGKTRHVCAFCPHFTARDSMAGKTFEDKCEQSGLPIMYHLFHIRFHNVQCIARLALSLVFRKGEVPLAASPADFPHKSGDCLAKRRRQRLDDGTAQNCHPTQQVRFPESASGGQEQASSPRPLLTSAQLVTPQSERF